MSYTITVDHPHFPEGTEFNVSGLGTIPNGSSIEVDEEAERLFMLQHETTVEEGFANDAIVEASGSSSLDQTEQDEIMALFAEPEEETPEVNPEDTSTTPPPPSDTTPPDSGSGTDTTDSGTTGTSSGGGL